jgi:hypothetical protein
VNTSFAAFCCQSHALLQRKKEKPIPAGTNQKPSKKQKLCTFLQGPDFDDGCGWDPLCKKCDPSHPNNSACDLLITTYCPETETELNIGKEAPFRKVACQSQDD